jgi:predicted CXXCH cytochrome family protein
VNFRVPRPSASHGVHRPNNPTRLWLVGLILVFVAVTVHAPATQALTIRAQGTPQMLYTWWLVRWENNAVACSFTVEQEGTPSAREIEEHCGKALKVLWENTPACQPGAKSCKGLYLHLASALEKFPATGTVSPSPASNATISSVPSLRQVNWLSMPGGPEQLATNHPLIFLAGHLIRSGLVNASECPSGGLGAYGEANACGMEKARYHVYVWQNRFDPIIYSVARKNDVSPYLLKGLFIQETQLWPAATENNVWDFGEFGLGQLNELGADTLLTWNHSFYDNFCPTLLNKETCRKDYISLQEDYRALLRGSVINLVRADCSTCPLGIDLTKAEASIQVFAEIILANRSQVTQVLRNATGQLSPRVTNQDLWRFTLVNYHAGPGCLYSALGATRLAGKKLDWKNVSSALEPGCQNAINYVDAITTVTEPAPAPPSPTPFPTMTSPPPTSTETPTQTITPTATLDPNKTVAPTVTGIPATETFTATPLLDGTITPTVTGTLAVGTPTLDGTTTATPTPYESTPVVIQDGEITYLGDQVLVKFNAVYSAEEVSVFAQSINARVVDYLEIMNIWTFEVPAGQVEAAILLIKTSPAVEFVEPVYLAETYLAPNDPDWPSQPYMINIQMPQAWDITTGVQEVIVAIIDTGVDTSHPELVPALWTNPGETGLDGAGNAKSANGIDDDGNGYVDDWQGWNTVSASNDVRDDNGHGTHVAGIVAAQGNNEEGMAGMAWGVRVLPVKAVDQNGIGTYMQVAEGIIYAADHGARIINLSLGSEAYSWTLNYAVNYAMARGALVIAATGDSGAVGVNYPAAYPGVLGVGATDTSNQLASFSTTGNAVDLAAPGAIIYSAFPGGSYTRMSGTSMSAAHVSGAAALLASLPQFTTANQIQEALLNTALDLGAPGPDTEFGSGLIQVASALAYVPGQGPVSTPTPIPTVGPTPTPDPDGMVTILADAANAAITNYATACVINAANYPDAALGGSSVTTIQENDGVSASLPLGFDFWYMGTRYTQIYASSNGWLSFNPPTGNTCTTNTSCPINDLDNSGNTNGVTRPFLAPLWDNLNGTNGTASYTTAGTAPNRAFMFEWWNWRNSANNLSISMRVILYESTGTLQFIYRQPTGSANPASASLGMTGTANTSFLSANGVACPPTWSAAAETTTINSRPATGTTYSFTPNTPTAPSGLNFTAITDTGMTLNWTDASANENGFVIYRSADNVIFTFVGQTAAGIATYPTTGLTTGTLYYWRVYAVTEGALSTALSGQQTTDAPPVISITAPANNSTFVQGTAITFTGTATDAIDGDLSASLAWTSSLDGAIGTGATFSKSTLSIGVHTITASATDSGGLTGTATITVTITDSNGNTPPIVAISLPVTNSTFVVGTNITFSGAAIDVPDGDVSANIQWSSSIDGNLGTGASISTSGLSIGVHTITAQVTDSGGLAGQTTIRISISDVAGNVPPDVIIISPVNGATFTQGSTIPFIGSATIPTNGSISHLIQWFDGATSIGTGSSFGLNTLSAGTHTITARATDSGSRVGTASIQITIGSSHSPHGSFGATTDKCAVCHRTHTSQSSPLIASPLSSNDFCLSCHASGEHTVSTHSNIDWPGGIPSRTEPGTFDMLCVQCHEPHSSTNLYLVRPPDQPGIGDDIYSGVRVTLSPLVKTNVIFTATTGTNSYDDGTSPVASRMCVGCHANTSNPGYPMVNHTGGVHNGGFNYTGQDCTSCHPHSLDSSATTKDGFMTGCRACHNTVQDRGAGTPRRQIVGPSGGDFTRVSHHVSGNDLVTDTDCLICHEMAQHKLGQVRLFNQDNSATVYALTYANSTQADANNYESFCRSCHDSNGRAGDTTPFSDNKLGIPLSSLWSTAQHNIIKLTFKGSCLDCHDNGHGSNKKKLLAPWSYTGPGTGTDLMHQEEGFCFQCHATGSPTGATPVQAAFTTYTNTATRFFKHDVNATYNVHLSTEILGTSFGGANRHIDCNDCHEAHDDRAGTANAPTVKPPEKGASGVEPIFSGIGAPTRFNYLSQATNEYQVCMKCHSSYTTLPAYRPDGWSGTAYTANGTAKLDTTANSQQPDWRDLAREFNTYAASFHPVMAAGKNTTWPANTWIATSSCGGVTPCSATSRVFCTDCHTNATPATGNAGPHGSPRLHLLKGTADYITDDNNADITHNPNELCFLCHAVGTYVTGNNDRFTRHDTHNSFSCYDCHDTHGSENQHLINFDASHMTFYGRNSQSAYVHTATGGTCYVLCHGKEHNSLSYSYP